MTVALVLMYYVLYFNLFQISKLNFVEKVFEYYVLECLCGYRVYFVVFSMPNYGCDYNRGFFQKVEGLLRMSSNLGARAYLRFAIRYICRLIDLEKLWRI